MARPVRGWWDAREGKWYVRLGEPSPTTGKRKAVALHDEAGQPIRQADLAGKLAAISRLLAGQGKARESTAVGPTVAEVSWRYLAWHKEQGSAEATIAGHLYWLKRFAKVRLGGVKVGDRAAASIAPEDVWAADGMLGTGRHRGLYLSVMACWAWAARPIRGRTPTRLLPSNALEGLQRPPAGSRGDCTVDWATTRRMLRLARQWAKQRPRARIARTIWIRRLKVLAITLIAHTGCRPFEAAELEWDEVDWGNGLIRVGAGRDKARRPGRKPRKPRYIAVPAGLLKAMRIVRDSGHAHPTWVFQSPSAAAKGALNVAELGRAFSRDIIPFGERREPPLRWPPGATLYAFRHSWQSEGMEVASVEGVSAAAGNSPAVLLSTYHHPRARHIQEVAEMVRKERRKAKPGRGR